MNQDVSVPMDVFRRVDFRNEKRMLLFRNGRKMCIVLYTYCVQGGVNAFSGGNVVVLRADHDLVVHRQPDRINYQRTSGHANQKRRRPVERHEHCVRLLRGRIHRRVFSGPTRCVCAAMKIIIKLLGKETIMKINNSQLLFFSISIKYVRSIDVYIILMRKRTFLQSNRKYYTKGLIRGKSMTFFKCIIYLFLYQYIISHRFHKHISNLNILKVIKI